MLARASLSALVSLLAGSAYAQEDPLAAAEQAYVEVNFAGALAHAEHALESGRYGPAEMLRIYQLIAIAAAAEGDDTRAGEACVRMFALDPSTEIDDNLSPRIRQVFLEALGQWTARRARFALEARRLQGDRGVALSLSDPLSMAARVVVHSRIAGGAYVEQEIAASETIAVPIEGLAETDTVELHARVLDAHGNRLIELGSEMEPQILAGEAAEPVAAPAIAAPPAPSSGISPVFFGIGAGLTLVSAGVLIWSGVDILEQHADYLEAPTLEKYYYGLDLQIRTNVLIATTVTLGAASALLAIFTDWSFGASTESETRVAFSAAPDAIGASIAGAFR